MRLCKDEVRNRLMDFLFGVEEESEVSGLYEYRSTGSPRTREDEWKDFFEKQKYPFMIGAFYAVLLIHIFFSLGLYIASIFNLDPAYLPKNAFYILFWILVPAGVWVWSTSFTFWNFHNRKIASLRLVVTAVSVTVLQQVCRFSFRPVLKLTLLIPVRGEITIPMVVRLSQGILLLLSLLPCVAAFISLNRLIGEDTAKKEVARFKVTRDMDLREDREFRYDFSVVKDIETGQYHPIQEDDRFLHGFADGTTGTAKTSSVLTVAVCNDLDQRAHNIDFQKRECAEALRDGIFEVVRPFEDEDFSIDYIAPKDTDDPAERKRRQERYDFLKYTAKTCGITVVAPNASWSNDVYELASARGFKVNRIDPLPDADGNPKKGFIGFNPLYVSPKLSGKEREVDITNKAGIFADVLSGLFQRGGGGDYYFTTLNNSWTIATCMLLMITYDPAIDENQPNPSDVQEILNDVEKARPYLKRMADRFGNNGGPYNMRDQAWRNISDQILGTRYEWMNCGINCGNYQYIWDLFFNDILGASKARMHDQANGLRMQINKFLTHPYIRNVLCVPDHMSVDLDRILMEGQITTVNYAWELGKSISMAFGQFWLLSFGKAVVRRPTHLGRLIPHFNYIDELAILLHPDIEEFVSLHRQYRNANFFAFQTLDQMDKNQDTRYLKGSLLGNCSTQILFGRISPTEMKIYEAMAGMELSDVVQNTVSETSLTTENPSYSYSTRITSQMGKRMEATDMRYRDFQEVTVFSVKQGSPEEPFVGRVDFLPDSRRKGTPRIHVHWRQFFPDGIYAPAVRGGEYVPWYDRLAEKGSEGKDRFVVDSSAVLVPVQASSRKDVGSSDGRKFFFTSKGVGCAGSMTVISGSSASVPLPPEVTDGREQDGGPDAAAAGSNCSSPENTRNGPLPPEEQEENPLNGGTGAAAPGRNIPSPEDIGYGQLSPEGQEDLPDTSYADEARSEPDTAEGMSFESLADLFSGPVSYEGNAKAASAPGQRTLPLERDGLPVREGGNKRNDGKTERGKNGGRNPSRGAAPAPDDIVTISHGIING
ncbi:MAG: TraM recognition domain-containing protein [Lachnospiraceae bacterium]|nr:TraM recognition domain-containing protein [Lachnospiraceae bacterium]